MAKEWIFILLHLLGVALYVTASPFDQAKKDYETLRADQKLLDGLARAHGPAKDKNKEIGPTNNPQGPEVNIQKGKLNVTHELTNYNNSIVQNGTDHDRKKRSPSYSRDYNVKNTMYSPPASKSYGKSYRPSSYGYGGPSRPDGGARAGRTAGRYSAEPMYGSPAGYTQVGGGGGGGYSAGGYGGGYSAPAMPSYGGGYQAAPGGYPGGYAPAPAAGAAAAAQDPYGMIDEKALAKYIDKLTNGSKSRRRRHSGSNDSNGSKHGKTRRRRKSKRGKAKATGGSRRRKVTEKAAKKGSRRRKTEKTSRRTSKRRKSSSRSSSSSQEYYDDVSAASYDEEPYSKPKARRARDNDHVKPLDMSEVYTPKPAYAQPLNYPPQKQAQSDLLLSSLFNSLFQSAATNPVPKPRTQAPPAPPTPQPQQQNVASELAKLGKLIQTTFRKMTSRLDGMKMAKEIRLRKETTPGPVDGDNFINSRSTSQWNNVVNRYQRT